MGKPRLISPAMFDIIGFDGDDTLWDNERLYQHGKERFTELLRDYSDPLTSSKLIDDLEVHNINYYGYGIKSYILSMIEAAIVASSGKVPGEIIQKIITIARDMLDAEVLLLDHVEETLAILSQKYDLMLITKGDQFEQERKVNRSGLSQYFRYVEIIGDKTVETYQRLFAKYRIEPKRFLMVGNSVKSDIIPVLRLGGKAIYIHYPNTWSHEKVSEDEVKGLEYLELESVSQMHNFLGISNRSE